MDEWISPPIDQQTLIDLAVNAALRHGLDGAIVCGVCEEESGLRDNPDGPELWNPWAIRFEPAFEARYIKPAIITMPTTEEVAKAMSFGLMQIMGETAREMGFKGRFLTGLCDPATGLEFGCRKLKRCFDTANGDVRDALLHWNGGSDQEYPRRVANRVAKYQTRSRSPAAGAHGRVGRYVWKVHRCGDRAAGWSGLRRSGNVRESLSCHGSTGGSFAETTSTEGDGAGGRRPAEDV